MTQIHDYNMDLLVSNNFPNNHVINDMCSHFLKKKLKKISKSRFSFKGKVPF